MANIVNIEDFFTDDNEKEGIWFEPKINGIPCGFEFLLTGRNTDENIAGGERYDKAVAETENIKDLVEKAKAQRILFSNRVAEFVKGIRPAPGAELHFGGKPLEYSVPLIQQLLQKSPLIEAAIYNFVTDTANFIRREKNA